MWFPSASGTTTAIIGTEMTLATDATNGLYYYEVDAAAMVRGDVLELRIYTATSSGGTSRLAWMSSYGPSVPVLPICASAPQPVDQGITITLKQTAGTGRLFGWKLIRTASGAPPPQLISHTIVSSSVTATTPAIDTTGANLLVVVRSQYAQSTAAAISDSNGNVWSFLTPATANVAYSNIGYVYNPIVGAGHTFTKTITGNDYGTLVVMAFARAGPFSGAQSGTAISTTATSLAAGSVRPRVNNSLVVSGLCAADNSVLPYTIGSGFSKTDSSVWITGTNEGGGAAYLIQGTAAAISPTWSWTGAAQAAAVNAVFGSGSPPEQAVAAGFTNLVFNDDFTTNTVLTNSRAATAPIAGFNWYWVDGTDSNILVSPSATAASVSNGNTGGGNYASSSGGILTLNGIAANPNNIMLVQSVPLLLPNGVNAPGAYLHGYFEGYMQFTATSSSTSGWVSWWLWALSDLYSHNGGTGAEHMEIDIAEYFATGTPATITANVHEWTSSVPGPQTELHQDNIFDSTLTQDSQWHLYGCLWTGNGTTGTLTFYRDNVPYGGSIAIGSATNYPSGESSRLYMALSAGQGWNVNIDYIRVWQ